MFIHKSNLTGVILAGGQSRRMGKNKAFLEYKGEFFIEKIAKTLQPLVSDLMIIGNRADYQCLGYPVYPDITPNCGPIGGIYTALCHSTRPYNLVLSCDIPLISTRLLTFLIKKSQHTLLINALRVAHNVQPLTAIYHRHCLKSFEDALKAEKLKLNDLFVPLKAHLIDCPLDFEGDLSNINTPEDFKHLWK